MNTHISMIGTTELLKLNLLRIKDYQLALNWYGE